MSTQKDNLPVFFIPIVESYVLLRTNGRFHEAPLYHRSHELFACLGKEFISLSPNNGSTSKTNTRWIDLSFSEGSHSTEKGKLVWTPQHIKQAA